MQETVTCMSHLNKVQVIQFCTHSEGKEGVLHVQERQQFTVNYNIITNIQVMKTAKKKKFIQWKTYIF